MHMVCAVQNKWITLKQFIVWRNICKLALYGRLIRREAALSSAHFPGGGGNSAYERGGIACRKFGIKPLRETDLGVAQAFFDP